MNSHPSRSGKPFYPVAISTSSQGVAEPPPHPFKENKGSNKNSDKIFQISLIIYIYILLVKNIKINNNFNLYFDKN